MTYEIGFVLALLVVSLVLFVSEKLRMDLVALLVLAVLSVAGLVSKDQALAGFSNPAVVTVWAMFILSAGLSATGVADFIGKQVARIAGKSEPRIILTIMLTAGVMSAFMHNTGVAALMLPVVMDLARRTGKSPSRLLMPMAYGCLLGGLTTLIGTAPNLVAATALRQEGYEPFSLFSFTPYGLPALITGSLFVAFIGRHLLPKEVPSKYHRAMDAADPMFKLDYEIEDRVFQLRVKPDSPLIGGTLEETRLGERLGLNVYAVRRGEKMLSNINGNFVIRPNDILFLQGSIEDFRGLQSMEVVGGNALEPLDRNEVSHIEVTLSPQSSLVGKSVKALSFRRRYGLQILAIWRGGKALTDYLPEVKLEFGDALLLSGSRERIDELSSDPDFLLLTRRADRVTGVKSKPKAIIASLVMLAVVLLVLFGVMPLAVAAIAGVVLMVASRALSMDEAYRSIDWQSVFLIACMIPLGTAMQQTGAAKWIADGVAAAAEPFGSWGIIIGLYIMTSLATTVVPTTALVLIMAPIAISAATRFGIAPQMIMMAVAMAASASFTSPISHPANVLVMGPGGYRFIDYVKMGILLAIVVMATVLPILAMARW